MSIFTCNTSPTCCPPNKCTCITSQINVLAPAESTTILDTLDLTEYDSVQWNIVVVDYSQNTRKLQAVFATHEGNTTPFHNIFSRIGSNPSNFNYNLDVDINLGSLRLKIDNNSLVDYIIEITKVPIQVYVPEI